MDGLAGDGGRSPNSMRESQRLLMMDSRTLTFPEYVSWPRVAHLPPQPFR